VSDEPFRRRGDRFEVVLPDGAREALRRLAGQYRELLQDEDPSTDRGVARLFPPAREDDPLANLEYERVAHDGLLAGRLSNIAVLEQTTEEASLSEDELLAWMGVANDLRLVLGTRLDLTEETTEESFAGDPERLETFRIYGFLSAIVGAIVEALPGS
jgi:uncharacterized protein DUF2017